MESTNIIQNTINRIDDCVELATVKQELLDDKGRSIVRNAKEQFFKIESIEMAKGNLVERAKSQATTYCHILSGIFIGEQAALSLNRMNTTKEAVINILLDVVIVTLAYHSYQMFYKHDFYKAQGKLEFGNYFAYLKAKHQTYKATKESDKILKTIAKIEKDKEKLLNDKSKLEQYLNNGLFMNYNELTSQLIRTNNKVNRLNKKISSDKVNK